MFIQNKCIISGSRTIAPEENWPPTLNLMLTLTETLMLTNFPGGHCLDTIISDSLYQKDEVSYFLGSVKSIFRVALFPGIG